MLMQYWTENQGSLLTTVKTGEVGKSGEKKEQNMMGAEITL